MPAILPPIGSYNKALVALLVPLIAFLNQRWGLALPMDPDTLSALVGLVTALAVYLTPNKVTATQAATVVAGVQLGTTAPEVKAAANVIVQDVKSGKAGV
jgi:hypothetical protein